MLCIVFPLAHVHVSIRILAESVSLEFSITEVAFISDTAIFDEHAEAIVSAVAPLSLVVLSLVLPHINAVPIEVVLSEFALVSMSPSLEHKNAEAVHNLTTSSSLRLGFVQLNDLSYILPLGLLEAQLFNMWLVKDPPCFPFLVSDSHVLIILSEDDMQLLSIEWWPLERTILICESRLILRVFCAGDPATVHE